MCVKILWGGRVTTLFLAHEPDYSPRYVCDSLNRMVEHDIVVRVYVGLYELIDDPTSPRDASKP